MTILDSAEVLLQAKNYSGSGDWQDESGNGHHAQLGTASGADTNDPLFLAHTGAKVNNYLWFSGVSGNNVTVTLTASTIYDYTITYDDDTTDVDTLTTSGDGILTFGNTDVKFAGLKVKKIDVTADGGGATLALYDAVGLATPFITYVDIISKTWTMNYGTSGAINAPIVRAMFNLHTDDEFIIPDHANLDFADTVDFTIIAVCRLNDPSTGQVLWDKSAGFGPTNTGYRGDIHGPSVSVRSEIADGTNEATDLANNLDDLVAREIFSTTGRRDDTTPEYEVFRNAVGTTTPWTAGMGDLTNALDLWLGNRNAGNNWINGQYVAFALWRSALTDAQIVDAHNLLIGKSTLLYLPGRAMQALLVQ